MTLNRCQPGLFLLILLLAGAWPAMAQDVTTLSPPDDLAARPNPMIGGDLVVLASDVGAVAQITGMGNMGDVFPLCSELEAGGTYRAVCQSGVFPRASYLKYTIFELESGERVSLVAGYYGEVDLAEFPELIIPTATPLPVQTPTPIVEPTTELNFEIELRPVATAIQQEPPPFGAPEALEDARTLAERTGQLGAEQTGTGASPVFFFASFDDDASMVWQRDDWLFMASAPSAPALTSFVAALPY